VVDHARAKKMAAEHLDRMHIHVKSVEQNTEDLSGGQRQAVAIARATAFDGKLVIMDEPTAALAIKEVGKVLDLIRSLKDHGVAVIIISHRMDDIFYCCDRVMALYQGTNFAESRLDSTSRNEVIGWIMGTKGHSTGLAHDNMH
jgi:simple sugar transport system ATP-binding protein